ncbi:hypothetical protein GCM10020369_80700 [Cryptosporangium minutisporangium]|uniref:Glycosyltransferase RgtA/B/C/D-like domain-containing protein n=1 Tax=Cryptosporangium minutisporangium TaxID=113569 RepID=A0ABP6TB92_9ACTN
MLLALVVLAVLSALPWEWSFIDDGELLLLLQDNIDEYGLLGGVGATIAKAAWWDLAGWGLFRPAFWVYRGLFYLLPVGPAHALRVVFLALAVLGPVVAVRRNLPADHRLRFAVGAWAGLAVLANGALWYGIWFPSLQELSAAAFLGLGLAAGLRRPWLLVTCWTVAAWFKSPIAWTLVALAVVLLLRRGENGRRTRAAGWVAGALGGGTVLASMVAAQGGSYSEGYFSASPGTVAANATALAGAAGPALVIVLIGAFLLGTTIDAKHPLGRDPIPLALLLGGLGYSATLLPWRSGGYYPGPAVYLVTVAVILILGRFTEITAVRRRTGVALSVFATGVFLLSPVHNGAREMLNVAQLRDCLLTLPSDSVIGYDQPEGAIRLEQIVKFHDPAWNGIVARVGPGDPWGMHNYVPVHQFDYYIRTDQLDVDDDFKGEVVCKTPKSEVMMVGR